MKLLDKKVYIQEKSKLLKRHDIGMIKEKITISSRSKEEALDYRYFLEGDIPWVTIESEIHEKLKSEMPESISSKKREICFKIQHSFTSCRCFVFRQILF